MGPGAGCAGRLRVRNSVSSSSASASSVSAQGVWSARDGKRGKERKREGARRANRSSKLHVFNTSDADARARSTAAASTRGNGGAISKPHVVVAGGGIGGLITGLALHKRGIACTVYEKVTEYKPFGGPIQLAGNALSMLEALDRDIAEQVMSLGAITGDRVNGLLDGSTGAWYCRFDTRKPAYTHGIPLTMVVSRYTLIEILRSALPEGMLQTGTRVMSYEQDDTGVKVHLENGESVNGDVLIGADGIRSAVREQMKTKSGIAAMLGLKDDPRYSGYTCYTGIADYIPDDVNEVGYQVFLGCGRYFVASDVGEGQVQWYAFKKQEAGIDNAARCMKESVQDIFGDWCEEVNTIINKTPAERFENRDIFDRAPTLQWVSGRVALLGDAAHAMQPNMGQGGCQTIEDAYHLSLHLRSALEGDANAAGASTTDVNAALVSYQNERVARCAAVQGFARAAALMASTYRPYLGSDPYEMYEHVPGAMNFWKDMEDKRLPHPGRVAGQVAMMLSIDPILNYITGGGQPLTEERVAYCQLPGVGERRKKLPDTLFKMNGIPGIAT